MESPFLFPKDVALTALLGIGHRLDSEGFSNLKNPGIRKEFRPQKASLPPWVPFSSLKNFIDSSGRAERLKTAL